VSWAKISLSLWEPSQTVINPNPDLLLNHLTRPVIRSLLIIHLQDDYLYISFVISISSNNLYRIFI
jgi:hypothetical protein